MKIPDCDLNLVVCVSISCIIGIAIIAFEFKILFNNFVLRLLIIPPH